MTALWRLLRRLAVAFAVTVAGVLWIAARPRPEPRRGAWPRDHGEPPPLPPGRLVAVPGRGEIFVRELPGPGGDAPTVVLLHGFAYPADMNWFRTYEALAQDARVIAVDHRGHGRGARPSEPFRLVDVADDVAGLLDELEIAHAVLVGYSMGGPVALLIWQRHPEVVRGLVLAATAAAWRSRAVDRAQWHAMGVLQLALRLLPRHVMEDLVSRQADGQLPFPVTRMVTQETPEEVLAYLPWLISELDRASAEDVAEAGRELGRFDARGLLPTVDVPVAVLRTTRDRIVPPAAQGELAAALGVTPTDLDLDHDGVISGSDRFVPALRAAVAAVATAATPAR